MMCTSSRESSHYVCVHAHTHRHTYSCLRKILTFISISISISNHICPTGTLFTLLIIYAAILTCIISCLRASGPLPRPPLTALANPNPLHHLRVLPARNGQCRIHARPERTRPLTGTGIEAARRSRERRPRRFPMHATALRSNVTTAGRNMHVKKFLGVRAIASCPPQPRLSLPVVLVLHGAIHGQVGGKVCVYSVCGEWHAEGPRGVEEGETRTRQA
jgi:hypothetical protein